jgi:hypothetical protein
MITQLMSFLRTLSNSNLCLTFQIEDEEDEIYRVVFSFQIIRQTPDVGRLSVIIPSLRHFFWETLRIHDP